MAAIVCGTGVETIGKAATVKPNSSTESARAISSRSSPTEPVRSACGEIVLVVEDESRVRQVTVARLADLGYRVLEASSGSAALAMLDGHPEVAVVFSDVVLPGELSGLDLARRVQQAHPGVHLILTSGYSAEMMSGWCEGLDLQVLPKPYRQSELARIFRDVLRVSASRSVPDRPAGPA